MCNKLHKRLLSYQYLVSLQILSNVTFVGRDCISHKWRNEFIWPSKGLIFKRRGFSLVDYSVKTQVSVYEMLISWIQITKLSFKQKRTYFPCKCSCFHFKIYIRVAKKQTFTLTYMLSNCIPTIQKLCSLFTY